MLRIEKPSSSRIRPFYYRLDPTIIPLGWRENPLEDCFRWVRATEVLEEWISRYVDCDLFM